MKLLVFEYSTCSYMNNLLSEGLNMLKTLLDDLDYLTGYDVDYLISSDDNLTDFERCNPIRLYDNLCQWLNSHVQEYDYVLFIAPEDDYIQYKITKIIEENNVEILCSDSYASYICCSKNRSYEYVDDSILKVSSLYMDCHNVNYDLIKRELSDNLIVKPDNKTSSDYIYHIKDIKKLDTILDKYKKNNIKKCIIQEYISGRCVSVSSICNKEDIQILSINSQEIKEENNKINYLGCKSPIDDEKEEELKKITREIINHIPGLKGFVGIDYIINNEKIYFIEINSRITTPYILLSKNSNINLTEYLIEYMTKNKRTNITFSKKDEFYKEE